jgi:hypothetical protein
LASTVTLPPQVAHSNTSKPGFTYITVGTDVGGKLPYPSNTVEFESAVELDTVTGV